MNASGDELDNLFRNHLAAELDPMRRQAGRAFAREVTGPMHRRLRINAWHNTWHGVCGTARRAASLQALSRRSRPVAAMAGAMVAAAALGFAVPRWLAGPAAPGGTEVAELAGAAPPTWADYGHAVSTRREDVAPADGSPGNPGRREWQTQVESANFVDPQTHARTEFYLFPHDQEVVPPAARQ